MTVCRNVVIAIITTGVATVGIAADAWPKSSWSRTSDPVVVVNVR